VESVHLQRQAQKKHSGFALLLMILLIVVLAGLIWLDPSALFNRPDPDLPWNEEFRLLKAGEEGQWPSEEQPNITKALLFEADAEQEDSRRGKIAMVIRPDGRIKGGWTAEYNASPEINLAVMACSFKGNIDASKIYKDDYGEDRSKLYFITKGKFIMLESNSKTNRNRSVKGHIYVTGWLDTEYNGSGEITITSDKRSFETFSWQAKGIEQATIFDLFK